MRISLHFWLFHINIDNTRFLRNKVSQLFQRSLVLIQIRQRTFQNSSDCHYNCEGRDQDELELRSGPELRVGGSGGRRRRGQVEARINPVNVFCSALLIYKWANLLLFCQTNFFTYFFPNNTSCSFINELLCSKLGA